ncbi:hypothetical protein C1646_663951 [Rhizophagus diaphanus]|nr:hypothetical protein C1646_663951 [Rhizophagus diaphanus] [Rhizophagus sp. MUCL 43196]
MTEIIEIDKEEKEYFDKYDNEYDESQYDEYTHMAVSPDGSIVATFNLDNFYVAITKVATNEYNNFGRKIFSGKISFDRKKLSDGDILGWSLAVSDIIDKNIVFVAISCITNKDMNPGDIEFNEFRLAFDLVKQLIQRFFKLFQSRFLVFIFLIFVIFYFLPIFLRVLFLCLFVLYLLFYIIRFYMDRKNRSNLNDSNQYNVIYQFLLSWISSKGTTQLFKFSLNDSNSVTPISRIRVGGVIGFLKTSKTSENSDSVTLVCTNFIGIHKINIKTSGNKFKECSYLLPEILFNKLEKVGDAIRNWECLSKSRYQEYLMVDVNNHQTVQNIEIYNINTLQLVNVFYKYQDSLFNKNKKPGIFAISTDSRLLAYSYGKNTIAIYLMENGLEVVSKKFDNIFKIKLLEFIKKDEKLFIIEEDRNGEMKFHVWIISGCLNDYFPNSKDHIPLSDNIFDLLKYNGLNYNFLSKANGKEIFLDDKDDDDKNQFSILPNLPIDDNDKKYIMHELEPWNDISENMSEKISIKLYDNDKRFLLIIGHNSIQLWKSKSQNFKDFKDFKNFENSDLVYISISKNQFKSIPEFQIKNGMTTVIIDAYNDQEKNLHIPQNKYGSSYSHYDMDLDFNLYDLNLNNLDLNDLNLDLNDLNDLKLNDLNDLKLASMLCQGQDAVMLAYLLEYYSENAMNHIGWMSNVIEILPILLKLPVYLPVTQLIEAKSINFLQHKEIRFVLFGHPSLLDLNPSVPTYTLDNGTTNFTLTGEIPENPFNTIWDAILSAYYWNTIDLSDYDYWPLKLLAFMANVILVLVLLNMIIALMNDAFTKAKEDGIIGHLLFRTDLIHDYESTHYSRLKNGPLYICFNRDSDLIKDWIEKSRELEGKKLYSWFNDESIDEENDGLWF